MAATAGPARSHSFSGSYGGRQSGRPENRLALGKENRSSLDTPARISDLDSFILSRFDPLLQIVKQLTARVHEVEATQVAESQRLESLQSQVSGHSTGFEKFAAIAKGLQDYSDRLSRMETMVQSQSHVAGGKSSPGTHSQGTDDNGRLPSPNIVSTASLKPSVRTAGGASPQATGTPKGADAESEVSPRTSEYWDGSSSVAGEPEDAPRLPPRAMLAPHAPETDRWSSVSQPLGSLEEDTMSEPWLFKVGSAVPISTIASTLSYGPEGTLELDAVTWTSEADMWHDVATGLENTPGVPNEELRPLLLSSDASAPYAAAIQALACACQGEVLLLVRGMPSKTELREESNSGETNSSKSLSGQSRIRCVAKLAVEAQKTWEALESSKPVEELGRLAMVLVGDGIGNSLRAGSKKFPIEPLI